MEIVFGTCHCGCGEKTSIANKNDAPSGRVSGQPMKYLRGHASRLSPVDYVVEDRGYETQCWVWQLGTSIRGYGLVKRHGKRQQAHRFYYERDRGPIPPCEAPDWLVLDHLCKVHPCVNPEHLELVTQAVNRRRGTQKSLTEEAVRAIRASMETQAVLAERFGVAPSCISEARRAVSWKDI